MRIAVLIMTATLSSACAKAANAFVAKTVARLDNPWGIAFLPDRRALVTEKPGRIRIVTTGGSVSAPLAGVPAVAYGGQNGLLDIVVGPTFAADGLIYFSYVEPGKGGKSTVALARAHFAGDTLSNSTVIFRAGAASDGGQPGGRIVLPGDGSLFLSLGERQHFTPAQDKAQTIGKIVRLTLDGKPWRGNPFVGKVGYAPEIWSLGHRNPYGLALDPATGVLWENEMGPKGGDEINVIVKGQNYGWPQVSQGDNYDGRPIPRHATRPEFAPPKFAWVPSISPSGLIVYSGSAFPAWKGSLFLGALSGEALIRLTVDGTRVVSEQRFPMGARIRDVEQGPDGAIWLLTDGDDGKLLRLTPK